MMLAREAGCEEASWIRSCSIPPDDNAPARASPRVTAAATATANGVRCAAPGRNGSDAAGRRSRSAALRAGRRRGLAADSTTDARRTLRGFRGAPPRALDPPHPWLFTALLARGHRPVPRAGGASRTRTADEVGRLGGRAPGDPLPERAPAALSRLESVDRRGGDERAGRSVGAGPAHRDSLPAAALGVFPRERLRSRLALVVQGPRPRLCLLARLLPLERGADGPRDVRGDRAALLPF